MKAGNELNRDILFIVMTSEKTFPELSKYIGEMSISFPKVAGPAINVKSFQDYYDAFIHKNP